MRIGTSRIRLLGFCGKFEILKRIVFFKILIWLAGVMLVLLAAAYLVLSFYPSFGGELDE